MHLSGGFTSQSIISMILSVYHTGLIREEVVEKEKNNYNGGINMAGKVNFVWYKKGAWWKRLRLNRKYKDRLFRFLFRDKRDLLDLYNALNSSNYSETKELKIVTMEDTIKKPFSLPLTIVLSREY